jgi:hypothetical protein
MEDNMSRSTTTSATAPQTGKAAQTAAQPQAYATTQGCVPQEKVAARAYQLWLKKGCKHCNDAQDWFEAEAEIKAEMARTGGKK